MTKATGASTGAKHDNQGKEVQLTSTDGKKFQGVCGHCNERAGCKQVDFPLCKAGGIGGGSGGGSCGSNKKCNYHGIKGHLEKDCWKKNPDNSPH